MTSAPDVIVPPLPPVRALPKEEQENTTIYGEPVVVAVMALVIMLSYAFLPWINTQGFQLEQIFAEGLLSSEALRRSIIFTIIIPIGAIWAAVFAVNGLRLLKEGFSFPRRVNRAALLCVLGLLYFWLFVGQYERSLLDALERMGVAFWAVLLGALGIYFRKGLVRFFGLNPAESHLIERVEEGDDMAAALKDEGAFRRVLAVRNLRAGVGNVLFLTAIIVALIALAALFINIVNQSFGYVLVNYSVNPKTLSEKPISELTEPELITIMNEKLQRGRLRALVRDNLLGRDIEVSRLQNETVSQLFAGRVYPPEMAELKFNDLSNEQLVGLLGANLDAPQLQRIILRDVAGPRYDLSWGLFESLRNPEGIRQQALAQYPDGDLQFRSWLNADFLTSTLTAEPGTTGILQPLIGSLWVIGLTILIAVPLGIGAAIYLEEYATKNRLNAIIETNIRNLAGVPSIIYGMLGLAVFARALNYLTSGRFIGLEAENGRTIISAALTMALLILPVVIANAQEALRAVPSSIREASYGVGATKWQTTYRQVLPAAIPGILTGVILSVSRAIGETAPLLVVGGLTFMTINPNGPFSKFSGAADPNL
jgi:phosphate transport system permease protein